MLEDRILGGCSEIQKHVILLALANGGEPVRGRTKLQKMMFMISYMREAVGEYGFEAGERGPYSETVSEEARYLADVGVLQEGDEISLTGMGRRLAEKLAESEDGETVAAISRYKEMLNDLTAEEVLAYAYAAHPAMATGSPARRGIERDMEKHVMSMLKKEDHAGEGLGADGQGLDVRHEAGRQDGHSVGVKRAGIFASARDPRLRSRSGGDGRAPVRSS